MTGGCGYWIGAFVGFYSIEAATVLGQSESGIYWWLGCDVWIPHF